MKRAYPLKKVHHLMGTGPVILVTTALKGRPNVMAMAWHTMMDFDPPLIGIVLGEHAWSFKTLKATKECVINIPTAELARKVVQCGGVSGAKVDKFARFGLTMRPARCVSPPLIDECFASLECQVVDMRLVKQYNFFIVKVLKAWADPSVKRPRTLHHRGAGLFMVAGREMTTSIRT